MAFILANLNCIANGPMGRVYTYHTSDTVVTPNLASSSAVSVTYLNSDVVTQLRVNDRIFVSHTGSGSVSQLITLVVSKLGTNNASCCMNV